MIAEPYINRQTGGIFWLDSDSDTLPMHSQQYSCFERVKLQQIGCKGKRVVRVEDSWAFHVTIQKNGVVREYESEDLINYSTGQYWADSESSRLLKRAEFLKAVCE